MEVYSMFLIRLKHQWALVYYKIGYFIPLLDKEQIIKRQDLIKAFLNNTAYLKDVRTILHNIGDISRLVSKLGALRINPRELLALNSYLLTVSDLKKS